jgi:glycosyltransferase involved in cell wall biosynthesis
MKILLLINSLSAGGAEVFITDLALELKSCGHTIEMYTYAGVLDSRGQQLKKSLERGDIKHHSGRGGLFKKILQLRMVIRSFKPDIIHSNLEQSDTLLLAASFITFHKSGWIRTLHSEYATQKIPKLLHKLLSVRFNKTIYCSKSSEEKYPFPGRNSATIENGISKPCITPATLSSPNKNITQFINIGSFHIRNGVLPKAQDIIIDAIKLIEHLNFEVVFVGGGAELNKLTEMARTKHIAHKCNFIGIHDHPVTLLQQADVFLLPSRFEGMPISCLEAIGCAKPMLLSDIPSLKRFNTECTLYCAPENPESLAKKMQEFIENKDELIEKSKSIMATEFVKYSIKECANKYLNQYSNILKLNT